MKQVSDRHYWIVGPHRFLVPLEWRHLRCLLNDFWSNYPTLMIFVRRYQSNLPLVNVNVFIPIGPVA